MALHDDEKAKIAQILGVKCSIMASTVAKLYLSSPDPKLNKKAISEDSLLFSFKNLTDKQWTFTNVLGALVFIIDRELDTFVFHIYDLTTFELRFEYELYEDIQYLELDKQFHAFEMEDCVAGLSFCDESDAKRFYSKVNALKPSSNAQSASSALKNDQKKKGGLLGFFGAKETKKKEVEITSVLSVTHNEHIGLNEDGTFDLDNIPENWKKIFKDAGIRKKDLRNPETAAEIIHTIAENTGMVLPTKVKQVIEQNRNAAKAREAAAVKDAYSASELKKYYTPQQLKEYEEYQKQVEQYERELAAYQKEQEDLRKWEEENERAKLQMAALIDVPEAPPPPSEDEIPPPPPDEDEVFDDVLKQKGKVPMEKIPSIRITPSNRRGSSTARGSNLSLAMSKQGSFMVDHKNSRTQAIKATEASVPPSPKDKTMHSHLKGSIDITKELEKRDRASSEAEKAEKARQEAEKAVKEAERVAEEAKRKAKEAAEAAEREEKIEAARKKAEEELRIKREQEEAEERKREAEELARTKQLLADIEASRLKAIKEAEEQKKKAAAAKASKKEMEEMERLAKERAEKAAKETAEMEAELARQEAAMVEAEKRRVAEALEAHKKAEEEAERRRVEHEEKKKAILVQQERMAKAEAEAKERATQARAEAETAAERQRLEEEQRLAEELAKAEQEYKDTMARIAQEEEEEQRKQAEEMQERAKKNAEKLREFEEMKAHRRRSTKKAPPLPQRLPDKPALPPGLPPAPPKPPEPPKLPSLPPPKMPQAPGPSKANLFAEMGKIQLKQADTIDKSAPDVTGTRGRDEKTKGFLAAIEKGTSLKSTKDLLKSATSSSAKKDAGGGGNVLMSKLVETMNARRGVLSVSFLSLFLEQIMIMFCYCYYEPIIENH